MIIYQIPNKAFVQNVTAVIPATFNLSTAPGVYSVGITPITLMPIKANAIYLIDRFSFAASIPDYDWCAGLGSSPPSFQIRSAATGNIYPKPYSLSMYKQDASFSGWYLCDSQQDSFQIVATGTFNQTSNTIGIPSINLVLTFDIYEITDSAFQKAIREGVSPNAGQQARGGR